MKRLIGLALVAASLVFVPQGPAAQATTCPTVGTTSTPFNLADDGTHTLDEASGIVASSDYTNTETAWVHEDSSSTNQNFAYASNVNNGNLRARITLSGVTNVDWEDISMARTTGTDTVVLSDTGDNSHNRSNDQLVAFAEPNPNNGNATVTPTVYPITFKDSTGTVVHPNVEAMVIDQGGAQNKEVLFFAKERDSIYGANSGGSGRLDFSVYSAGQYNSLSTTSNDATYVTSISGVSATEWSNGTRIGPVAADIDVGRNYLILKNYQEALLWPRNGTWDNTLTTTPDAPCVLATGSGQFEGVAFSYDTSRLFQVRDSVGNGDTPLKEQSFTP